MNKRACTLTVTILVSTSLTLMSFAANNQDIKTGRAADGSDGSPGNPPTAGTDGAPGLNAFANSDTLNEVNTSDARGQEGGHGGNGGEGQSGSNGGDGGNGGDAGSALAISIADTTATATNYQNQTTQAYSEGRTGGQGGTGGDASGPGVVGGAGGRGGDGGSVTSIAHWVTDDWNVRTYANAAGGNGGQGEPAGEGETVFFPTFQSGFGLNGRGGDGGSAESLSTILGVTNIQVRADARAQGGQAGSGYIEASDGGLGGSGFAEAYATNLYPGTSGELTAQADAIGNTGGGGYGAYSGAVPGYGGDGGSADGIAFANAGTNSTRTANAYITASGGQGGEGYSGAHAGDGGSITLLNRTGGATRGNLTLNQTANGGTGGGAQAGSLSSGSGGTASSTFVYTNLWANNLNVNINANGGRGGGTASGAQAAQNGNSATTSVEVYATNRLRDVNSTATGGRGGDSSTTQPAGNGGPGIVQKVYGESLNGGEVLVMAQQIGGRGGNNAGSGTAGHGADSLIANRVDGETTGTLYLRQRATGGEGGSANSSTATPGRGGTARSELIYTNNIAQLLNIQLWADGGTGGEGDIGVGGDTGGNASLYVDITAANSITFDNTRAIGGNGGGNPTDARGGDGGNATLEKIYAESTSGQNVSVSASAQGGPGAAAFGSTTNAIGGNGGNSFITNAVNGETTGDLTILQHAIAGNGGGINTAGAGTPGLAGESGSFIYMTNTTASSIAAEARAWGATAGGSNQDGVDAQHASGNYAQIHLVATGNIVFNTSATATGGQGGDARNARAGDGKSGTVLPSYAESTGGGNVDLRVTQSSGRGGNVNGTTTNAVGGNGGDSHITNAVSGMTTGTLYLEQNADAGKGGNVNNDGLGTPGLAGNASSYLAYTNMTPSTLDTKITADGAEGGQLHATNGIAPAGGTATAYLNTTGSGTIQGNAEATGGTGGTAVQSPGDQAYGGAGGAAHATRIGHSTGGNVDITAQASGGFNGNPWFNGGLMMPGGDATAIAHGISDSGNANVTANAFGGNGRAQTNSVWGAAHGQATAEGATGTAWARAYNIEAFDLGIAGGSAQATAQIADNEVVSEARQAINAPIKPRSAPDATQATNFNAVVYMTGYPSESDAQAILGLGGGVADDFDVTGNKTDLFMMYTLGGGSPTNISASRTFTAYADLNINPFEMPAFTQRNAMLGFVNPRYKGNGFDTLRIRYNWNGTNSIDTTFNTLTNALAYFDNNTIDLGTFPSHTNNLNYRMEITLDVTTANPNDGFWVDAVFGNTQFDAGKVPPTMFLLH